MTLDVRVTNGRAHESYRLPIYQHRLTSEEPNHTFTAEPGLAHPRSGEPRAVNPQPAASPSPPPSVQREARSTRPMTRSVTARQHGLPEAAAYPGLASYSVDARHNPTLTTSRLRHLAVPGTAR